MYLKFFVLFSIVFFPRLCEAQLSLTKLRQDIDAVVVEAIQKQAFPGCVILAFSGQDTLIYKPYGYFTYDSIQKVQKESVYDLASLTKVLAGTLAIMKLYENCHIKLDEEIGQYIAGLGKVGQSTFREVLAHQAGLTPWIPYYQTIKHNNGSFYKRHIQSKRGKRFQFALNDSLYLSNNFYFEIKKQIKKTRVSKDKVYKYSGLFFYLIPEVVKNQTGLSFEMYLEENFYQPLNSRLMFNPLSQMSKEEIVPTEMDNYFRGKLLHGEVHDEGAIMMRGVSANAGLFGDAKSIGAVFSLLLNGGKEDSIHLLRQSTISLFTTVQYPANENRRGLGFDKPLLDYNENIAYVAKSASPQSYGHAGFTGTMVWADPQTDLVFVFLSNRVYPTRDQKGLYHLNIRPRIHQLLYDYMESDK